MKRQGIVFIVIMLFILAVVLVHTFSIPYRARVLPLIVIVSCIVLLTVQLIMEILSILGTKRMIKIDDQAADAAGERKGRSRVFAVMAWAASLPLMIWLFGFLVSLPLFVFAYAKTNGERWTTSIGLSIGILLITYVGFGLLFKIPLYSGFLFR